MEPSTISGVERSEYNKPGTERLIHGAAAPGICFWYVPQLCFWIPVLTDHLYGIRCHSWCTGFVDNSDVNVVVFIRSVKVYCKSLLVVVVWPRRGYGIATDSKTSCVSVCVWVCLCVQNHLTHTQLRPQYLHCVLYLPLFTYYRVFRMSWCSTITDLDVMTNYAVIAYVTLY